MNFELWFRGNKNATTGDFYQWDSSETIKAKTREIAQLIGFSEGEIVLYPHMRTFNIEIFDVPLADLPEVVERIEKTDFFENWLKIAARLTPPLNDDGVDFYISSKPATLDL